MLCGLYIRAFLLCVLVVRVSALYHDYFDLLVLFVLARYASCIALLVTLYEFLGFVHCFRACLRFVFHLCRCICVIHVCFACFV